MKIKGFRYTKLNTRIEVKMVMFLELNWHLYGKNERNGIGSRIGTMKESQMDYRK